MAATQEPAQGRMSATHERHLRALLAELGYSEADIERLATAGLVAVEPERHKRRG